MAHSAMQRRGGCGAQRKVISGENEAGLQRKQRSCQGRMRGERETEPAASSASVVGFSSLKLHRLEICELSLYLSSKSSTPD